ncbi:hypothetical protein Hanom_Chr07g00648111 [Helianthus anomalus]
MHNRNAQRQQNTTKKCGALAASNIISGLLSWLSNPTSTKRITCVNASTCFPSFPSARKPESIFFNLPLC